MVLAGIGGKTVAEAKANLSFREVGMWQAYIAEHGALSPVQRDKLLIEHFHFACAQICATVAKSVGAKLQISDFMPKLKPDPEPKEEQFASIEDVMRILRSARVN